MANYLDSAGLTAYDRKIKAWSKSSIADITSDAINSLFVNPLEVPYVTFTAQEDNSSIGLKTLSTYQTLEYSTDTTTWNTFDATTNISLNNGDKVYVRGVLRRDNSSMHFTNFKMIGKIAASGNCNAIWDYQDLNAPLKKYCGMNMFNSCTSLTTAPELPATELVESCYKNMFVWCTSLNHITCLATDVSTANCTSNWLSKASNTGTFVKHPNMTSWTTGTSGIPEGWEVVDAEL